MQFTELTTEEFDHFTRTHFSHFTQTHFLKPKEGSGHPDQMALVLDLSGKDPNSGSS